MPNINELADTELNTTSAVVATFWPIESVKLTAVLPSKETPLSESVTPVPWLKVIGLVKSIPIPVASDGALGNDTWSETSSVNWPLRPTFLSMTASVSAPTITFLGVICFCVVERWSKLPSGNK